MTFLVKFSIFIMALCFGQSADCASTIGTSSNNGTSPYDATDAITAVSLSGEPDIGKRGQRNFYDGRATGRQKGTMFDDMRRKLKSRDKEKQAEHKKKTSQNITAGNNCRRGLKKLIRCKMGRRAWMKVIVVFSVVYSFLISPVAQSIVHASLMSSQAVLSFWPMMGIYGTSILIPVIYACVLVCFCRSKTGKCLLDKIWNKKEKEEAPTETQKNEGKVNKESKKT
ncbi:hypothetical protein AK88_05244 [Plasmodium fragile]|uniref:Uncharacterized protein n=1 Tax=Plasmodium fragile TaxID=5857 RepID=A0A0D9QDT5_PLAFR|nr:uncharacterized protein AK88_05244 [Plasmodium fragile]KJP85119.1 hypothetical protein AK88_05244 [Plasmodium fragile]